MQGSEVTEDRLMCESWNEYVITNLRDLLGQLGIWDSAGFDLDSMKKTEVFDVGLWDIVQPYAM